MKPNLREITANEADTLWELGVSIWFKSDAVDWKVEHNVPYMRPFWQRWAIEVGNWNPLLAVEVE